MGLTVHFNFVFKGTKRMLMKKLAALKSRFEDLPVKAVSKVVEIERASIEMGYPCRQPRLADIPARHAYPPNPTADGSDAAFRKS